MPNVTKPNVTRLEILKNRTSGVLGFCFVLFSFSALVFFFLAFGLISRAWAQGMVKGIHPPAVWAIHNKEDMGAELKENQGCGLCFAVDSSRFFVTNFHVLRGLLKRFRSFSDLTLSQEGNPSELKVHRLLIVSGLYDLALFEVNRENGDYMDAAKSPPDSGETLFSVSYERCGFTRMVEVTKATYEDFFSFMIAFDQQNLLGGRGSSGGPVLNSSNQVVGVMHATNENMSYVIKGKYLKELIAGQGEGVFTCPDPFSPVSCIRQEEERVKKLSDQGNVLAMYQVGRMKSHIVERPPEELTSVEMEQAADQGFPRAEYSQGITEHLRGNNKAAFYWLHKAARKGHPIAQYNTGVFYHFGLGEPRNEEQAGYWIRQSAGQGYIRAKEFAKKFMDEK